ncbi:Crp/Fnr family transcriptional regulator [Pseudonocardia sp. C8]|uniref:Crp/Fnr family transcriptional regulator n=1 Tax=Pseudonocardia sp. C8 TaxID=2762759 RepID=UPI001642B34C|nr:Crp/Fnr family transcriptional regulator [Pseudonocardia sp. C8]MBC3194315.1 Crp/Fnr family transcriptional regulator [Pseudonocardia sp. C8]
MDPTGILRQTPIFRDLSVQDIAELLPDVRRHTYGRGRSLWFEGDRADDLVIVAEGQLKAHRVSVDGREVIMAVFPAVSMTGEVGLFHPRGTRWLGLTAMTASTCLLIRRAPLLAFMSRHPAAMQRMLEQLSITAVRAAYLFSDVAFGRIGKRVAGLLLSLLDEYGEVTPDGVRLRFRLSQGELAAHVAATRENVNRALSTLIGAGVISQRDGHFYIRDRTALERAAQTTDAGL